MKNFLKNKMLKRTLLGLSLVIVMTAGVFIYRAMAVSTYTVTEATATVGTATALEMEYTVDTGVQTWANGDTLTVTLPDNFPIWSALTYTAEYDTDATNNGVGETAITQGAGNGQYSDNGVRILTVKWNATGWGAAVTGHTVRILVTAGAIPAYADATSTFTFGGTTAAVDTNPTDDANNTDDVAVSAADIAMSVNVTAVDTVGETGDVVATFTIPYALADNDELRITFPDNFDITGANWSSDTFTGSFDACSDTLQVLACTASGGMAAETGTITISGVKTKYAADAVTNLTSVLYDISATANIASATNDAVAATFAITTLTADPNASAVATVGSTGAVTSTITFPVALVTGDTIKFTFPANYDVSGLTAAGVQSYGLDNTVTVAKSGQIVTLTLEGAQGATAETITFENTIKSKYATSTESVQILIEKVTSGADVVAASADLGVSKDIDATVAADPGSSVDISGINQINEVGNVVFTLDVDYAMVAGDTVSFTLPDNFNVASSTFSADNFTGQPNFSGCTVSTQTIICTVNGTGLPKENGKTITLSGITAASVADASTYTTTLYDTSASANIATAANGVIAATLADTTAPTVVDDWSLNMNTGTMVINFSEAMDTTANVNEGVISIQQTNNTDVAGELYTLTDSVSTWSDSNTLSIALSTTDLNALKADAGLAEAEATSFLEIVAGSLITDAATAHNALDLTNVTDGACIDATTFVPDTTAPAITSIVGTSLTNAGDTIVITYSEPMNETTLTEGDVQGGTVLALDTSTDAGDADQANIVTTNATAVWSATSTVLTITLNETTNGAYIPSGKYIGATSDGSIQDMAARAQTGTEIYSASSVTAEATLPTMSGVVGTSITNAGDTIAITFSEPMNTATLDIDSLTGVTSITDSVGGVLTFANATGLWTGKTVYTITLDEATDFAFIRDNAVVTVVLAATVTDLVGNTISGSGVDSDVDKEATIPTISSIVATSVNAGGDTIAITFSEPMATTTITTALLQANSNITLDYSNDAGDTGQVNMGVGNATVVWTGLTVATITLNEETDVSFIPDLKYVGVTLLGVTDLVGNAEAGLEAYTGAGVADENNVPTYTVEGTSVSGAGDVIVLTFNEVMATSTLSASTGITSITGSTAGAFTLTNDTGLWAADGKTYTVTLNETTDGAYIRDGESVTVVLANTVTDLVDNAVAQDGVADAGVPEEAVAPTISSVVGTSITNAADTVAITFSEPMDTATLSNVTGITSITGSTGGAYTLANDTGVWSGTGNRTVYTVTLDETTDGAYIRDGESVTVVLAGTVFDLVGNAISGGGVDAAVPKEVTAPTISSVVGASVDKAGDTIAITFSEPMATTTLTASTGITSITGSTGGAYTLANDTGVWSGTGNRTIYTVTLDEATDGAFITNGDSVTVVLAGTVTDLAGNAISGGGVDATVAKESTQPTITVTAASVDAAGDTVTITSDEVLASTALTASNWTVQYDDNGAGLNIQTLSLANATVAFTDSTKTIVRITLDEVTDGSAIPSSKYVKVTPNASNIKDLVGNAAVAADYTGSGVSSESSAPTITTVSVVDAATGVAVNPTIIITFSEALGGLVGDPVKLYADANNNDAVDVGTDTIVPANVILQNNGASTKIYLTPLSNLSNSGNYIYRVSTGVKDLSGNALAANADYDFTTVAPSADATAPVLTDIQATSITTTGATITWTTNEVASSTVQYGLTSSYGTASSSDSLVTSHSIVLTGLTSGAQYHFRVKSTDGSNNTATSVDGTFTTTAVADGTTPPVPVITTATSTVNADFYTIAGTAAADTPSDTARTIRVFNGATLAGTANVPIGQTTWSVNVSLTQGVSNSFTATAADSTGNTSAASDAVVIIENATAGADVTAPTAPVITTTATTTNADFFTIAGTVTADATSTQVVKALVGSEVYGTVIVPKSGTTWSVVVALPQSATTTFTITSTDEVGNVSTGNPTVAITESTTAGQGNGTLAVTSITPGRTYATAGGGYAAGWSWTFNVTVPTNEASTSMKFADWVSGDNTISVYANSTSTIRIYSAQSSNATASSSAVYMTAANTYSSDLVLNADLDAATEGRQIQIIVEALVPTGSAGGSYSTSYGIQSE